MVRARLRCAPHSGGACRRRETRARYALYGVGRYFDGVFKPVLRPSAASAAYVGTADTAERWRLPSVAHALLVPGNGADIGGMARSEAPACGRLLVALRDGAAADITEEASAVASLPRMKRYSRR